jgi:hypothetical protein
VTEPGLPEGTVGAEHLGVRVFCISACDAQQLADQLALVLGEHMATDDEMHLTYNAIQSGWQHDSGAHRLARTLASHRAVLRIHRDARSTPDWPDRPLKARMSIAESAICEAADILPLTTRVRRRRGYASRPESCGCLCPVGEALVARMGAHIVAPAHQ